MREYSRHSKVWWSVSETTNAYLNMVEFPFNPFTISALLSVIALNASLVGANTVTGPV